ncbi:hypothetical protein [Sphingomonas sp.]|uniref:hypothetical protein n=1 Tax=Sphingomonas sp. TaxID=28214 RepID=UPI0035A91161
MRRLLASLLLMVSACTTSTTPPPVTRAAATPIPSSATLPRGGLERVLGQNERSLIALFGKPDAALTEGTARKLQFVSGSCILDTYLYPKGAGAPVVTHVDARQPDGSPIDRVSCVGAIARRGGGK